MRRALPAALLGVWSAALVLLGATLSPADAAPAIAIPPCAQTGPCVVVQVLDGTAQVGDLRYFYADDILGAKADIADASYPIKGGTAASVKPGSSLSRLIGLVPGTGAATYADVVWDDAYQRHLLTGQELRPGTAAGFVGGLVPAFYSTDPQGSVQRLTYIRPQRTPDDDNGAPGPDQGSRFTDPQGSFLVRVHLSGQVLDVGVTATPVDGSQRAYALTTDQGGAGLSFDWVLPDGSRSTDPSPTFTFPSGSLAGTYPVSVGVAAADGSFGWGSTDLRAGAPPAPASSPAATQGPGGDQSASAGPTRNPKATKSADPNPAPTGSTGTPQPSPSAAPTPVAQPTDGPTSLLPPPPPETLPPLATPVQQQAGESVSGILLAGAEVVDPATDAAPADPPPTSPAAAPLGSTPFTVPAAVLLVAAALLLLLAGAASESERVRRLLGRWARMAR